MTEIAINDYLTFIWQILTGKRLKGEMEISENRTTDINPHLSSPKSLSVLDLANGRLSPQMYILAKQGHTAYGIDMVNGQLGGIESLAYRVVNTIYRVQSGLSAEQRRRNFHLIQGDVGLLPFPSESFDLVTSVAAFEHFMDVEGVLAEVHRILKPAGLLWVGIHSFTSLSGGHNVRLMQFPLQELPPGVEPWDHLRERNIPFRVPLNEWRIPQYREALARRFRILKDYCAMYEGEALLTPEISAELSEYSREELLCASRIFLVQKD